MISQERQGKVCLWKTDPFILCSWADGNPQQPADTNRVSVVEEEQLHSG